jgi:hypothetical protein
MFARGNASAAGYTFCGVNPNLNAAIRILICDIGRLHGTFPDAPVTACAKLIICFYDFLHNTIAL